jgi:hypothetical protein
VPRPVPGNQPAKDLLAGALEQLMSCLVEFDPYFEIIPGTKAAPAMQP